MKPGATKAGQPSVTVSLVTFNGMRWLPGCLASLKEQTLGDYELLVLDNASTDGSVEWLREQLASEPRMKLTELDAEPGLRGSPQPPHLCRAR